MATQGLGMFKLKSYRFKTLLFLLFVVYISCQVLTYRMAEDFSFSNISRESANHQKSCLSKFLEIMKKHKVELMLFDVDILSNMFKSRVKAWHDSKHECKQICKFHPENKHVITFTMQARQFRKRKDAVMADFKVHGYAVHLSTVKDPMQFAEDGSIRFVPSYLWLAKKDHVIHVPIIYERQKSYAWIGPVTQRNWKITINVLKRELSGGWEEMEMIESNFPTYEQAFEKSQRLMTFPVEVDGQPIRVPYHIKPFLQEYSNSKFIECNIARARIVKRDFDLTDNEELINGRIAVQNILDLMKKVTYTEVTSPAIPFWLTGGTLLGWFRQCDILPYGQHVSLGMWAEDINENFITTMNETGFILIHRLGLPGDSLQLRFLGQSAIPIDIFAFYKESHVMWHGATNAQNGRKYRYNYQKFTICWTEFLTKKVRVPCEATTYVEDSIGHDWIVPRGHWIWNLDPANVETNGKWLPEQASDVIWIHKETTNKEPDASDKEDSKLVEEAIEGDKYLHVGPDEAASSLRHRGDVEDENDYLVDHEQFDESAPEVNNERAPGTQEEPNSEPSGADLGNKESLPVVKKLSQAVEPDSQLPDAKLTDHKIETVLQNKENPNPENVASPSLDSNEIKDIDSELLKAMQQPEKEFGEEISKKFNLKLEALLNELEEVKPDDTESSKEVKTDEGLSNGEKLLKSTLLKEPQRKDL